MKIYLNCTALMAIVFCSNVMANVGYYAITSIGNGSPAVSSYESQNNYKLTLGANLNEFIGLEVSYMDGGSYKNENEFTLSSEQSWGAGDAQGFVSSVDTTSYDIAAKYLYGISDQLSVFGLVGVSRWHANTSYEFSGRNSFTANEKGTDTIIGGGVLFDLNSNLSILVEYGQSKILYTQVDNTSVGIKYNF